MKPDGIRISNQKWDKSHWRLYGYWNERKSFNMVHRATGVHIRLMPNEVKRLRMELGVWLAWRKIK